MAKRVPHLVCKGGRYYFRKRVPLALASVFGSEVSEALGNLSKAQAEVKVRELSAHYADLFLRELHSRGLAENPPAPSPVTPRRVPTLSEVTQVSRASARELLAQDEEVRIDGTRTELGTWWFSELSDLDAAVVAALAEGDTQGLWHRFIADLSAHGLSMPEDVTERRRMLRAWAMEQAKALKGITARSRGEPIETPPPVAVAAPQGPTQGGRKMRDALQAWRTSAKRPAKTEKAFERHVATFERMAGDPDLSTLRKGDAVRFRDALQAWAVEHEKTARTADNVLTTIKALANVARDREWLDGNPFERLAVTKGGKESEGREPWTPEELTTLFNAPLFTAYELPSGDSMANKAGADAAYWVPLMAAYIGARPSELCQLRTDDISEGEGGLVIEFREREGHGQRLKNKASWRAVPVHSELIRLGLKDYWGSIKATGDGPLFPRLPRDGDNGAAGQFGQWFGEFKRQQGFETSTKTLHSFRHTVETELGFAGASPTLVDAITGHVGQGIGRKVYGATIRRAAERLRPVIELLAYPGLVLPRAYG